LRDRAGRVISDGGTFVKRLFAIGILATIGLFPLEAGTTDGTAVVPEPATIGLMGAGLAAFGFAAWRKNRKR
jgi:PEP-CTERM motif-containing protein